MIVSQRVADTITKDGRTSLYTASGFTETNSIHCDFQDIIALEAFMLIDLSDTVNWPHTETGHLNIEYVIAEVSPDTLFSGQIKVGFLENVDGIGGNFHQILDIDMGKKSDLLVETLNFGSHGLDCQTDHHFGPVDEDNSAFRSDLDLKGIDGEIAYPSGPGDLCLVVDRSAGAVDVSLTVGYEAVA